MWIVDIYGKGLDLNTGRTLQWIQKSSEEPNVYGVCLFATVGIEPKLRGEHSSAIFSGTEDECRGYIAELVEKLNAPVPILSDYTSDFIEESFRQISLSIDTCCQEFRNSLRR